MPRDTSKDKNIMLGLDLGQITDPSALAAVESQLIIDDVYDPMTNGIIKVPRRTSLGHMVRKFYVVGLRPFEIGVPYPRVVDAVRERIRLIPGVRLVADATGIGRPTIDAFAELRIDVAAITITGGAGWSNPSYGEYRVSKYELVSAMKMALETGNLEVSPGIKDRDMLKKELINFRVHKSKAQNEIYDTREGDHDDLCIAVGLPVWFSWYLDNCRPFICGVDKVVIDPPRNPMKISANIDGIFGRRRPLILPNPDNYRR
jgi:hypothetical protein